MTIQIKCKNNVIKCISCICMSTTHVYKSYWCAKNEFVQIFKHDNLGIVSTKKGTECFSEGAKAVSDELMLTYKVHNLSA